MTEPTTKPFPSMRELADFIDNEFVTWNLVRNVTSDDVSQNIARNCAVGVLEVVVQPLLKASEGATITFPDGSTTSFLDWLNAHYIAAKHSIDAAVAAIAEEEASR